MFWKHWDKTKNSYCFSQGDLFWEVMNLAMQDKTLTIRLYNKTLGVVIGNVTSPKNQLKFD